MAATGRDRALEALRGELAEARALAAGLQAALNGARRKNATAAERIAVGRCRLNTSG